MAILIIAHCQNIILNCKKHGDFSIKASDHLYGRGCIRCSIERGDYFERLSTESIQAELTSFHGDKYTLKEENKDLSNPVIVCPEHGDFVIRKDHLSQGCSQCNGTAKITRAIFLERSLLIHGSKYGYDLTKDKDFKNSDQKISIECPNHGTFKQKINIHLEGSGCPNALPQKVNVRFGYGLRETTLNILSKKSYLTSTNK